MTPPNEEDFNLRASKPSAYAAALDKGHKGTNGISTVSIPDLPGTMPGFDELKFLDQLEKDYNSGFTEKQRINLLDQLIVSLDQFYVHRDLKWARHAVDVSRSLRSLRREAAEMGDLEFHAAIAARVKGLRDIHTAYVLPDPYRRLVTFLPFTLAACREEDAKRARIMVTHLLQDFGHKHFTRGAEILTWNGVPIDHAVKAEGLQESAGNPSAQYALGVRLMTIRWLGTSTPPPAHWVTMTYLDRNEEAHEIRMSWRILELPEEVDETMQLPLQAVTVLQKEVGTSKSMTDAMVPGSLIENSTGDALFKKALADEEVRRDDWVDGRGRPVARTIEGPIDGGRPDIFEATIRETSVGNETISFGHVIIRHFNMISVSSFVDRFRKILAQMPKDFLVLDIRSNPGGNLKIAECMMQTLTPHEVKPLSFQFRATREVERLVSNDDEKPVPEFAEWVKGVTTAVANGQQYSPRLSMTESDKANVIGQEYYGNVALLVDGITYSSGDIFAAHFADLSIGPIIGTDARPDLKAARTGGGGANMLYHEMVAELSPSQMGVRRLPGDAHLHYALRRFVRSGTKGWLVEEAGVTADEVIPRSHDDLLNNDRRLLRRVVGLMSGRRRRHFEPEMNFDDETISVTIKTDTQGPLIQLHVFHNGKPERSIDVRDGEVSFEITRESPPEFTEDDPNAKAKRRKWYQHVRVEAYEHTTDHLGAPQNKLIALFDRKIGANGRFNRRPFR